MLFGPNWGSLSFKGRRTLWAETEKTTLRRCSRKAEDIFASLEERDRTIPNGGRLSKASFQIKFSDSKTPRTVTLSSGNRAQFKRDDDAEILEEWLIRRGFIIVDSEDNGE